MRIFSQERIVAKLTGTASYSIRLHQISQLNFSKRVERVHGETSAVSQHCQELGRHSACINQEGVVQEVHEVGHGVSRWDSLRMRYLKLKRRVLLSNNAVERNNCQTMQICKLSLLG
jgi:hypothetical protein